MISRAFGIRKGVPGQSVELLVKVLPSVYRPLGQAAVSRRAWLFVRGAPFGAGSTHTSAQLWAQRVHAQDVTCALA